MHLTMAYVSPAGGWKSAAEAEACAKTAARQAKTGKVCKLNSPLAETFLVPERFYDLIKDAVAVRWETVMESTCMRFVP